MVVDYIRRILIVSLLALCVSLLFWSGSAAHAEESGISTWVFPADGYITDHYGTRGGNHKGMDIGGEHGSPVYSVDEGVVSKSYYSSSYGHVVFVKHPNGYETVYGHLHERAVSEGQAVGKGEKIGEMGNTGRSTGTHLHFEVHNGEWTEHKDHAIDPYLVFGEGETGQTVFAKEHDPYQVREVALKVTKLEALQPLSAAIGQEGSDGNVLHRVAKGETLWGISQVYGVSTSQLMKQNGLGDSTIISGQQLIIPSGKKSVHLVKSGETLFGIARLYNVSVDDLLAWNEVQKDDPIIPAQELIVNKD
ncbi:peptidoglycan DD-metalloendopeptidase family protein [Rossellomorea aquimaris]|uniref:Peptidoglycan DD-metalloendopeptidase family protein n=1 Tax=Rossellomorea aquimaris TaxID=189382 RepID=A0A5D4TPD3_9BACI|nr:peptidoglycan DD-metalloendopeptidase family protein [Rossellomorea aquimaris]TYS76352.1 peptidoglycan DD-metalloendopeptidase family protein [Rossellomorea aquimaris]